MRAIRRLWAMVSLAVPVLSLALCSVAVAQDDEIQDAVNDLMKSINASVARQREEANSQIEQTNKMANEARQQAGVAAGDNVTIVTCTDVDGQAQRVVVHGLSKNTVIMNCQTGEDDQPRITVKGDGATREIGTVTVEDGAENTVIVNEHRLAPGTEIVVGGKNAKAMVGTVDVQGGKMKNSTIINKAAVNGSTVKATGEGARATVGSITIE